MADINGIVSISPPVKKVKIEHYYQARKIDGFEHTWSFLVLETWHVLTHHLCTPTKILGLCTILRVVKAVIERQLCSGQFFAQISCVTQLCHPAMSNKG